MSMSEMLRSGAGQPPPSRSLPSPKTPWGHVLALRDSLEVALEELALGRPDAPNALEQTRAAGQQLQRLCALEPDMMLATAQRLHGGRYCVRHSIATACVLEFMLARLGISPGERRTAVLGALTMNLGMFELQETLYNQAGPMTPEQRDAVHKHPNVSVALLQATGLEDRMLFSIVAQHHENLDGTGYPRKLSGDQLWPTAQAVMLADRWCAMIAERAYRPGAPPDQALRLLLSRIDGVCIPPVSQVLNEVIGSFPPGTPVRLVNGEAGVVWRRSHDPIGPLVRVLRTASGPTGPEGVVRVTIDTRHRIEASIPPAEIGPEIDPDQLWSANSAL